MKDLFLDWTSKFFDDSYWKSKATVEDKREFADYASDFNTQYLRIMTLCLLVATVLWWPLDLLIFQGATKSFWIFSYWRIGFLIVGGIFYLTVTYTTWFRQNLLWVSILAIVPGEMIIGYFLSMIEFEGVWPYGGLPLSILSVLFLTSFRRRILLTLCLSISYPLTYFLMHPKGFQYEMMTLYAGLFLFPVLMSVLAGHKFMLMTRKQILQDKHMQEANRRLATFGQAMVRRVNIQDRALQDIAKQKEQVREGERASLAQELHDHLGQLLTGMRFELDLARMQASESNSELEANLNGLDLLLGNVTESVRDVLTMLRPKIVSQSGLMAAVRWLVDTVQERASFTVELTLPKEDPELNEDFAIALFRIVQESLTNALKHAQANTVWLGITLQREKLLLNIRDDGVGCSAASAEKSVGLGLSGMKERVQSMHGTFSFQSEPGAGTQIMVSVPLHP